MRWMVSRIDWAMVAVATMGLVIFGQTLRNEFVAFDDELLILDNPRAHGLTWTNVRAAFTTYDPELYVPLTLVSYQAEYSLFGASSTATHATNVVLHACNAVLVLAILRRFLSRKTALLCALLFAVHPLTVEAVAWASGRKDLLAATFAFGSMVAFLRYRERGKGLWWSVALFACGLLAKVSVAPVPVALVLFDWLAQRRVDVRALRSYVPHLALSIVFLVVALLGKQAQTGNLLTPLLLSPVALSFYLRASVLPVGLSIFYPFVDPVTIVHPWVAGGIALTAGITVACVVALRKTRVPLGAWLLFVCFIAPSLLNVAKGGDGGLDLYFASDRYAYVALLGPLLVAGWALRDKARWALVPVIGAFAVLTIVQAATWRTSETLFSNVIANGGGSHVAYTNLAGIMLRAGKVDAAEALYRKSLEVKPTSRALFNLARIEGATGRHDDAIGHYRAALAERPNDAEVRSLLGSLLLMRGRVEEALPELEAARRLRPDDASIHYNLGLIYEHLKRPAEARREFEEVLRLKPGDAQALKKLGR